MNTVAPNIRMEDKLIAQVKRIYHDTKQAINECNFLSKKELDEILLTPSEEQLIMNVNGTQVSLIKAATLLRELHARFLRTFVLSAFDLTWDMITTPKRFEYAKQKELELYISLMSIANLKQDEIKSMIRDTIQSIKQTMVNDSSSPSSSFSIVPASNNNNNNHHAVFSSTSSSMQRSAMGLNLSGKFNAANCNNSLPTSVTTPTTSSTSSSVAAITTISSVGGDTRADDHHHDHDDDDDHNNNNSNTEVEAQQHGDRDDMIDSSLDECHFNANSLDNISSRSELQLHRQEIQEYVLQQLNAEIANKLVGSVESLRNSYVGTLERCLASLEQNCVENNEPPHALLALRQILNAAYRVEVNVQSSTSLIRVLWEKMKQLVSNTLPNMWSSYYSCCIIDDQWRRQQALDIIDSLSETRLAKSICAQFRSRLKASHEQFISSLKDLELQHAGRLQHTEDLRLRVRKMHAPRMAKFALESTSLIDLILYGMPCLEKEIGRGQYGVVYACESWAGHSPCAVKSVVPPDDKHWYDLAMEFYYTRCIPEHERIVSIYGSVIDHSYGSGSTPAVLLVMSRLNRDLYSAIKSGLDWLSRLQVAIDVVEGIRFLHNQGLVHRDIKLKNILLDSNNRAKITDLGFCKPEAMMSGSVVGTPIHMSPELFSGRYDSSVDVYAFGILFWYICAGHVRLPHIFEQCQTRDQLWNCVRRGVRPERLPQFDNECWQLMSQCWEGDRLKRPHLGDVEIKLRQIYARYN